VNGSWSESSRGSRTTRRIQTMGLLVQQPELTLLDICKALASGPRQAPSICANWPWRGLLPNGIKGVGATSLDATGGSCPGLPEHAGLSPSAGGRERTVWAMINHSIECLIIARPRPTSRQAQPVAQSRPRSVSAVASTIVTQTVRPASPSQLATTTTRSAGLHRVGEPSRTPRACWMSPSAGGRERRVRAMIKHSIECLIIVAAQPASRQGRPVAQSRTRKRELRGTHGSRPQGHGYRGRATMRPALRHPVGKPSRTPRACWIESVRRRA